MYKLSLHNTEKNHSRNRIKNSAQFSKDYILQSTIIYCFLHSCISQFNLTVLSKKKKMPLHVEKCTATKAQPGVLRGSEVFPSRRHSHIQMCNSAGLLPYVAWSLLAQEMVTQQESSDSDSEACQRVREPHSGKFWLDVKKAQGCLNTAT